MRIREGRGCVVMAGWKGCIDGYYPLLLWLEKLISSSMLKYKLYSKIIIPENCTKCAIDVKNKVVNYIHLKIT